MNKNVKQAVAHVSEAPKTTSRGGKHWTVVDIRVPEAEAAEKAKQLKSEGWCFTTVPRVDGYVVFGLYAITDSEKVGTYERA